MRGTFGGACPSSRPHPASSPRPVTPAPCTKARRLSRRVETCSWLMAPSIAAAVGLRCRVADTAAGRAAGPPPAVAPLGPRALSCGALHVRGMLLMSVTVVAVRRALPGQGDAFVARALQLLHEQAL